MTAKFCPNRLSALGLSCLALTLTACPGLEGTVSGEVTYDFVPATYSPTTGAGTLRFVDAEARPVRGAIVQVRAGSEVVGEAVTDAHGKFTVSYQGASGDLTLVALAKTATPSITVEDNTDNDAVWAVGTEIDASTTNQNLHATHGWTGRSYDAARRVAAPFAILDSMYTAATSFTAVRPVAFPPLRVNWSPDNLPEGGRKELGQIGTSHFSFGDNEIYILGKAGVDTDEFDTHVIVHEWAHYFEANLSRSDSPGGPHGSGDELDPRIAFGEGYGNALAAMLLPESIYADTSWPDGETLWAFGFDAETEPTNPNDDPLPGVFSEMSVCRLLYDLWDSGSAESHDRVGVGLGPIYDVLVGAQRSTAALTTIAPFVSGLLAQPNVNLDSTRDLLAHYGMGPIEDEFGTGDADLEYLYLEVSLPFSGYEPFQDGTPYTFNKKDHNRYFFFEGTGRPVTVTASNFAGDVYLKAYASGRVLHEKDDVYEGVESFSFNSVLGQTYVVVMTNIDVTGAAYDSHLSITSP